MGNCPNSYIIGINYRPVHDFSAPHPLPLGHAREARCLRKSRRKVKRFSAKNNSHHLGVTDFLPEKMRTNELDSTRKTFPTGK